MRSRSLLLLACLFAAVSPARAVLPVMASTSVLADLTREVGGDRVKVDALVGPDQDAHVFQPSPSDVRRLAAARVFVVNGLGLEGWQARLTGSSGFRGVTVVAAAGVKPLAASEDMAHEGHAVDPHAWHDPVRVLSYVTAIRDGLAKADPAGRATYQQRADALSRRVEAVHVWAGSQFAGIPDARRKVVTSHDAFAYLGARYKIRFLSPQGVSTDAEASASGVAALVRQLRQEHVKAVFFENMSDRRLITQIAREAGVRADQVLYSDALSAPSGPASSWEKMFRYNVTLLVQSMR